MSLTKVSYSMVQGAPANILDYGADPTGVTDSTSAIQTALNTGKMVWCPAGTYLFSALALTGLGSNYAVLSGEGAKTILQTTVAANTAISLGTTGVGIENCLIENLVIQGNSTNTGGLQFGSSTTYAAFIKLKNVTIQGFTKTNGFGIGIGSVQELDCENVILRNNYDNVRKLVGGYCTATIFRGKAGYIGRATHRGIDLTEYVQNFSCSEIVIEENAYEGVYSAGQSNIVTISQCYVESNAASGGLGSIVMTGGATRTQSGTLNIIDTWFSNTSTAIKSIYLDWAWNCSIERCPGIFKNGGVQTTTNTSAYFGFNNAVSSDAVGINPDTVYGALLGVISYDDYSALTAHTSKRGGQIVTGATTLGYAGSGRGAIASVASGVVTPLFTMPGMGQYEVIAWLESTSDINYMASATVLSLRGLDQRIATQSNGTAMQITVTAGGVINATQLSGSPAPISYSYLRIL